MAYVLTIMLLVWIVAFIIILATEPERAQPVEYDEDGFEIHWLYQTEGNKKVRRISN